MLVLYKYLVGGFLVEYCNWMLLRKEKYWQYKQHVEWLCGAINENCLALFMKVFLFLLSDKFRIIHITDTGWTKNALIVLSNVFSKKIIHI